MTLQDRLEHPAIDPLNAIDPTLAASFPPDFLWGAATSAYQIEGATAADGRGPSIWDHFTAQPGVIADGTSGTVATDHYHRMAEDVELMAALGLRAYRFSIAWPRIFPDGTGAVNPRGLDFYDRLVDALLARGITPVATLYHWDLPQALQERGGWLSRQTAQAFAAFAATVAERLGDRVAQWITLNEPWVAAIMGHSWGVHAPGLRDPQAAAIAAHHLLLGHGLAVQRLRAIAPTAQVGITVDLSPVYGTDDRPETRQVMARIDTFKNRAFLEPVFTGAYPATLFTDQHIAPPPIQSGDMALIAAPLDFLGINYYSRTLVGSPAGTTAIQENVRVPGATYTAMDWEVFPEGLTAILTRVHQEYHPPAIMITENGAAFPDHLDDDGQVRDPERLEYVQRHIAAVAQARQLGVPVTGYFAWSLMDNFEWGEGYTKRFGLVYVDYPTQRRIIKASGAWYRAWLRAVPGR